jgi:hypothetical protein
MKSVPWPRSGRGALRESGGDGWNGGDGGDGGPTRVANEKELDEAEKCLVSEQLMEYRRANWDWDPSASATRAWSGLAG